MTQSNSTGDASSSVLAQEIASQPDEIAALIDKQLRPVQSIVKSLPSYSHVVIAARGSSDHAATYARYVWGHLGRVIVAPASPSLYTIYGSPPRFEGALVVGVSQSGQSPDVVSVVQEARKQGRPTLALTNDASSPLAKASDHVLELCTSPELSVAATKTYTCQLTAVALFGAALSKDERRLDEVRRLPEVTRAVLDAADSPAKVAAAQMRPFDTVLPIARGINLCTAEEAALKLREMLRLSTHAFSAADFRHGSIALVVPGYPLLLIAPSGAGFADMMALKEELLARGADVTVITDVGEGGTGAARVLPLGATVPEWLSPVTAIMPAQRLAFELTLAKGLNPDKPAGLPHKVVRTL